MRLTIQSASALRTVCLMLLEIAAHGAAKDTLQKARKAREKMERLLAA